MTVIQASGVFAQDTAPNQLRTIVERIERMNEEAKAIADDIKDIYSEAKSNGYDVRILRKVIAIRKLDPNARTEQEAILNMYLNGLGMLPLFERTET